jgi:hypothetical protein
MTIWFAHCFVPGPGYGLVCPVLSSRARACRRDHQAPSAPLPDVGITFVRETFPPPAETLLSGHRSYEHMCQSRVALLCFGSSPRSRSLCRLLLAPAAIRIFSTLFCESFLGCLVPYPGGPIGCMSLLTSPMSSAFPKKGWVGFPLLSTHATFRGSDFEAADIPLCSGPQVCSPSRLLPPLRLHHRAAKALTSGQSVLRCLRTHRIY